MPKTISIDAYTFAELSDEKPQPGKPSPRTRALDWLRDCTAQDIDLSHVVDDWAERMQLLGFTFETSTNGKRSEPRIYWSGFSAQGDGACFEARWHRPSPEALAKYAENYRVPDTTSNPSDDVRALPAVLDSAKVWREGSHYYHARMMRAEGHTAEGDETEQTETDAFLELCRQFANVLYAELQAEYEYQLSDEALVEAMEANEYLFTAQGSRRVVL